MLTFFLYPQSSLLTVTLKILTFTLLYTFKIVQPQKPLSDTDTVHMLTYIYARPIPASRLSHTITTERDPQPSSQCKGDLLAPEGQMAGNKRQREEIENKREGEENRRGERRQSAAG